MIVITCTVVYAICWVPLYMFLIYIYFLSDTSADENTARSKAHFGLIKNMDELQQIDDSFNVSTPAESVLSFNGSYFETILTNSVGSFNKTSDFNNDVVANSLLDHIRMACLLLSYCNGMLNPIVLLSMSRSLRRNLMSSFRNQSDSDSNRKRLFIANCHSYGAVSRNASAPIKAPSRKDSAQFCREKRSLPICPSQNEKVDELLISNV